MAATRVPLLGAAACLAGLAGCATFTETIQSTEVSLARHQPQAALAAYKKRTPAGADRVLDLMNTGMLERMVGDFDGSTRTLEEAKGAIEREGKVNTQYPRGLNAIEFDPSYKGKHLQMEITVEDKGVFTTPWTSVMTYARPVGAWVEHVCAENTSEYYNGGNSAVPTAGKPEF